MMNHSNGSNNEDVSALHRSKTRRILGVETTLAKRIFEKGLSRRSFLTTAVSTSLALWAAPFAFAAQKASPGGLERLVDPQRACGRFMDMNEGPLYPPTNIPWVSDLTTVPGSSGKAQGQLLYLFGTVADHQCRPVSGAVVEIWQTDNNGIYKHPRQPNQDTLDPFFGYFGRTKTKEDGSYLFKTLVPVSYVFMGARRAAHIHLKMQHPQQGALTTEIYFAGEEDDRLRQMDLVFSSQWEGVRDQMIVPKEDPKVYAHMNLPFEKDALCCKYDLAFI